jgi:2-oxoglutarate ferredoxin oxidoreductase subunit beta
MTGGQFSPLSGVGTKATTAPYMNIDREFDTVELAKAAGATFVARTTVYHVKQLQSFLKKAIAHDGFSVLEVLSQCPTYFGRKNKKGSAVDMLNAYRDTTVPVGSEKKKENPDLIERGIFVEKQLPEYCHAYGELVNRAQGK